MEIRTALFPHGKLGLSPGVVKAMQAESEMTGTEPLRVPLTLLALHVHGDYGNIDSEDWTANENAIIDGGCILSAHTLTTGQIVWVLTEADRTSTTFILPEEY